MKNTLKRFGFAVLVMAIALSTLFLTGCEDDSPEVDSALNGTWTYGAAGLDVVFNNGDFQCPGFFKGTYTTSGGNITATITYIYGDSSSGLQSKWYTKPELKTVIKTAYKNANYPGTDAQIDALADASITVFFTSKGIPVSNSTQNIFTKFTATYSVSNNTLTLTTSEGEMIFTKS